MEVIDVESDSISKTSLTLNRWLDFRLKLFFEGILVGLVAGLVVVLYRYVLDKADSLRTSIYGFLHNMPLWTIALWFLILLAVGLLIGYISSKEPMISGSGIPQVKGQLSGDLTVNWFNVIIGKFIGGVLAIGAGLSLGREGPSVQLGSAIGHGLGKSMGRLKIENKYLITSGASAGLAAAFNAPLAGVIFALEEMHKNFSPIVLTSAMAASLTADFICQQLLGQSLVFNFTNLTALPLKYYFYLIILGIIIGCFGAFFNYSLVKTMSFYNKLHLPVVLKPLIPLMIAGVLGFTLPEVLGGGHQLVNSLDGGKVALTTLLILVVAKFLFTMISYGSGVPGGIFLPLLVIGALTGNIFGEVAHYLFNLDANFINNFIILSMAAYFTAIVKAPITGAILITEMTGSFSHLLAMATVSATAYIVTDILKSKPIYDELLEIMLAKKGLGTLNLKEYDQKKIIIEAPVCLGSKLDQKRVKDIVWPRDFLLVGIKRGETEIIPKGNTLIHVGDYLIVLTNENKEAKAKAFITSIAGECIS